MRVAKSRPALKRLYFSLSPELRRFFGDLPGLIDGGFSLEIMLAYVFFRVEQGQNMALYCGARKLHRTEASLTWKALDRHRMERRDYPEFFRAVYGFAPDAGVLKRIRAAEAVRDRLMHGKSVPDQDKRSAISLALHYAEGMNGLISGRGRLGFKPFGGELRGFVGRLPHLGASTTRWILKGMGFDLD